LSETVLANLDNKKKTDSAELQRRGALIVTEDDSLADLLLYHDIKVRDSILLSILSDHGPMKILRLSGVVGIELQTVIKCVMRLAAANLLSYDPDAEHSKMDTIVELTSRGQQVASRICDQLK
jgi:hypothetical protein